MSKTEAALVVGAFLTSCLVAGCGTNAAAPPVGTHSMLHPNIIQNTKAKKPDAFYVPNPIRVRVGQRVTWTNKDSDPHDVTADSGEFASPSIPAGGKYIWIATRPGTYTYFCTIHPEMHGVVVVSR